MLLRPWVPESIALARTLTALSSTTVSARLAWELSGTNEWR